MELLFDIAMTICLAVIIRLFVFTLIYVDGSSMRDTLKTGDRLLATRLELLFRAPQRGRIVICLYPGSLRKRYVKRLIGLPGDTIEIRGGETIINGLSLYEPYVTLPSRRSMEAITLDDNEYFVMGDNRANSRDSRMVGPLRRCRIIATVRLKIWPYRQIHRI